MNRLVARVKIGGEIFEAHNTNTGRLEELLRPGALGLCVSKESGRLRYRIVAIECCGGYAVIDTRLQEAAFREAVERGFIWWLRGCSVAKQAPRFHGARLDYMLDCGSHVAVVEVKSAVLRGAGEEALYPDCPTERGRRHLRVLTRLAQSGRRALIVFIAGFPGATMVRPNRAADPLLADTLLEAIEAGVEVRGVGLTLHPPTGSITLYSDNIPVVP